MANVKFTMPAARKQAGLTQREMAKLCGVSESTVINWEKFRTEPTVSQATMFAEACGMTYDDIIFLPSFAV